MLDHEHPERTQRNQYRYLLNGTSMSGIMLTWGKWVPTYSTQIDVFRLMEVPFTYVSHRSYFRFRNSRFFRHFPQVQQNGLKGEDG